MSYNQQGLLIQSSNALRCFTNSTVIDLCASEETYCYTNVIKSAASSVIIWKFQIICFISVKDIWLHEYKKRLCYYNVLFANFIYWLCVLSGWQLQWFTDNSSEQSFSLASFGIHGSRFLCQKLKVRTFDEFCYYQYRKIRIFCRFE